MINNQINRRIGSCEEHLFLSLSPLFFRSQLEKRREKGGRTEGISTGR